MTINMHHLEINWDEFLPEVAVFDLNILGKILFYCLDAFVESIYNEYF